AGSSPVTVINANGTGIVGPIAGGDATIDVVGTVNPNCGASQLYDAVACPPSNDEACSALLLECGDTYSGISFEGATQSFDDACGGSGTADVWFTFEADGIQAYTIAETQTDVVVDLWSGDDCGNLTQVFACADSPEFFSVIDAGTYYFRIRPWGTAATYGVSLTCSPLAVNDEACTATVLECGDVLTGQSFLG